MSLRSSVSTSSYLAAMHIDVKFPLSLVTLADRLNQQKPVSLLSILRKLVAKPVALIFSKNSSGNMIEGLEFPADMPPVRWPKGYDGCSRVDVANIRKAWVLAHYLTWRAHQVMEFIARNDSHQKELWDDGYLPNYGNQKDGFTNYAPRAWFGPFDEKRFDRIRESIAKVWEERFLGKTFEVTCRIDDSEAIESPHPCYTVDVATGERPSANHWPIWKINFCESYFNNFDARLFSHGKGIVHEVFHWLQIPGTGLFVTDRHNYYQDDQWVTVKPLYGDKAAHIANNPGKNDWNYSRTVLNNDNYALFIYMLGRSVYKGKTPTSKPFTQFPSTSFKW
jgi:hypothetical protein